MPTSYSLGDHFEAFVKDQLDSGRYNNASEVVRDGLRLLEDRARQMAALDAAIARGLADADAGRVRPAEDVFDRLRQKYEAMPDPRV